MEGITMPKKNKIIFSFFLVLLFSQIDDRIQEELAKFGYRLEREEN
jgi:c-di-GMP-binding flagellar brake protein YcgR